MIISKLEKKELVSFGFLMNVIDFRFGIIINPNTLRCFCRATNGVKVITGISLDSRRVVFDYGENIDYLNEVNEIKK